MKVKICDLQPNPWRDINNYPIVQEKIDNLTRSIKNTGFWDNILGRLGKRGHFLGYDGEELVGKFNRKYKVIKVINGGNATRFEWQGKVEIAYGYHRLMVLRKEFKPSHIVDIPVKDLDDAMMIKIMANENMVEWRTNVKIIHETIRVAKEFLESHPEEIKKIAKRWVPIGTEVGGKIIARFLQWPLTNVYYALRRLKSFKAGTGDKESVESMPDERTARLFAKEAEEHGLNKKEQKAAANKIVKEQDTSPMGIASAIIDAQPIPKQKKEEQKFEDFLDLVTKKANSLREDFKLILSYRDKIEIKFYQKSLMKFAKSLAFLDYYLQKFKGKEEIQNDDESGKETKQIC